jgi:hypothetical protein
LGEEGSVVTLVFAVLFMGLCSPWFWLWLFRVESRHPYAERLLAKAGVASLHTWLQIDGMTPTFTVKNAVSELRIKKQHVPSTGLSINGPSIVHLSRIDHNCVTGNSIHPSDTAPGAMTTGRDNADSYLVV